MRRKVKVRSNRLARHMRIRKKIFGTSGKPRLAVFRSLKHLQAQIIDDLAQRTLVSASTHDKDFKSVLKSFGTTEAARELGRYLAEKAKGRGIQEVAFDRAGYLYHGRVKALAESLREGGLKF